jgi:hypothetical protein
MHSDFRNWGSLQRKVRACRLLSGVLSTCLQEAGSPEPRAILTKSSVNTGLCILHFPYDREEYVILRAGGRKGEPGYV